MEMEAKGNCFSTFPITFNHIRGLANISGPSILTRKKLRIFNVLPLHVDFLLHIVDHFTKDNLEVSIYDNFI
ncbi:hypothetical protein HNQ80_001539 [Anaerosolibacter carboniphilus]|uniref:Uncharacterized protein n=1 Tax=Anaerosolibacter carboniphilus TaxID=1417629 RepID=A0A841KTU8_9FIRM|nr:hypothetical protein [Anaerosolibacter carboniphilus]